MGSSTDAILFYGYCWDEEGIDLFGESLADGQDWEDLILARRDVANPWDGYHEPSSPVEGEQWIEAHRNELDAWNAAQKTVREEFGVEVGWHCSGECEMPFLHPTAAGAVVRAHRGYPAAVQSESLAAPQDWAVQLDRFMAEFGIEKPQPQPGWWLVSYRG